MWLLPHEIAVFEYHRIRMESNGALFIGDTPQTKATI
jgi:hypothetical protein